MAWMSLSCASVMGGAVSRLCSSALPVMGRLRTSRVVSASAMRAMPVLGCVRVSHKPRKASSIRLVGGRMSALSIFLSRNRVGGMGVSYLADATMERVRKGEESVQRQRKKLDKAASQRGLVAICNLGLYIATD